MAADPAGRILVADTRGGQLLVFGIDPLIERQAYRREARPRSGRVEQPGLGFTDRDQHRGWLRSATGIPVEKVRYPTVRQPDSLAFDEASSTLYVVSGSGAGGAGDPRRGGRE